MLKRFISLLPALAVSCMCFAQSSPSILWQTSLGGFQNEYACAIKVVEDGNYLILGSSRSSDQNVSKNYGAADVWILKIDPFGNIIWEKNLGTSVNDISRDVEIADDGYILVGSVTKADSDVAYIQGGTDIWLVKVSHEGNIIWEKTFGGSKNDYGQTIEKTQDGNFLVGSYTTSNDGDITGNHSISADIWIMKIDTDGNPAWQKCYGGTAFESVRDIESTPDGGFITAGYASSTDGDVTGVKGHNDYWLVKANGQGNIEWQKTFGGDTLDLATSIVALNDGYLIGGKSISQHGDKTNNLGLEDIWLVRTDDTGKVLWEKSYGGAYRDELSTITQTFDGGFLLTGNSLSKENGDVWGNYGGSDYWIVKLNDAGKIEWQKCMGGSYNDSGIAGIQNNYGNYVVVGSSESKNKDITYPRGNYDIWVAELSMFPTSVHNPNLELTGTKVYPTITNGAINIAFDQMPSNARLSIYNTLGQCIYTIVPDRQNLEVSLEDFTDGIYLVNILEQNRHTSHKIILQR